MAGIYVLLHLIHSLDFGGAKKGRVRLNSFKAFSIDLLEGFERFISFNLNGINVHRWMLELLVAMNSDVVIENDFFSFFLSVLK